MISGIKAIHLELTNKCMLKCPRCARTEFINKFGINKWTNKDLELDSLQNFLDLDLTGMDLMLCGNTGDPIYYPELFQLIKWLKQRGAYIHLITNGSYKSVEWWTELSSLLDEKDYVVFSIDGVPENFTEYRKNADWDSISMAMQVMVESKVTTVWKYIPFRYNIQSIDTAKQLSNNIGIDKFMVTPSDRWIDNDEYKPVELHMQGARDSSIIKWRRGDELDIAPKCFNNSEHYIDASGFYMPCCYVGDWRFYYKSTFYKNKNKYDIRNTTLSKLLMDTELNTFYNTITSEKPQYCKFNCPKHE